MMEAFPGIGFDIGPLQPHETAVAASELPGLCRDWRGAGCRFATLVVESDAPGWCLHYLFLAPDGRWRDAVLRPSPEQLERLPSISSILHAADWDEREAEDLFGLRFEGHPRLGDFILHDEVWPEGVAPMRPGAAQAASPLSAPRPGWRPLRVAQDPGAFAFAIGPVYEGGVGESMQFLLETVGEDVIRTAPRLFYKYRAVEMQAQGQTAADTLRLAESFAATSAVAHGLAFCLALENAAGVESPPRAQALRLVWAELERMRHHAGAIAAICRSTALNVAEAQAAVLEEDLLRASALASGHRYLHGLLALGGVTRDLDAPARSELLRRVAAASAALAALRRHLSNSSSFLDRLEEVGAVPPHAARELDLVGPVARASALCQDLRRASPYLAPYSALPWEPASEDEGDGYARLRVLFTEARTSARMIERSLATLPDGELAIPCAPESGAALGWVEAPAGAALHWLRLDGNGRIRRWHIGSPSFRNWLGFHLAAENFAFQDFPIILATFALSATECDR